MIKFKFTERDTEEYDRWISFYPEFERGRLQLDVWSYFDPRPQIITNITTIVAIVGLFFTGWSIWSLLWIPFFIFGWGKLYIKLPYDTGKRDECENPWYGYYFYNIATKYPITELVIGYGKDSGKYIDMPWSLQWYKTSLLMKDEKSWEHETVKDKKDFYDDKWKELKFEEKYPYTYTLKSGKTQNVTATINVEKREWRRRWLMSIPLFNKVSKDIKIDFSGEVGEGAGSWKGGVTGCGYTMKKDETPLHTLQRMSRERKFNR